MRDRNGCNLDNYLRYILEARIEPIAAVIPAPIVYTNVVAVKTLVVDSGGCIV